MLLRIEQLSKLFLSVYSMPGLMPGLEGTVINLHSPSPFKAHSLWEDRHRLATILDVILSLENGETDKMVGAQRKESLFLGGENQEAFL